MRVTLIILSYVGVLLLLIKSIVAQDLIISSIMVATVAILSRIGASEVEE